VTRYGEDNLSLIWRKGYRLDIVRIDGYHVGTMVPERPRLCENPALNANISSCSRSRDFYEPVHR
jgi:hypothetical protein